MKTKLLTLCLALLAATNLFAQDKVKGIWYDFNSSTKTATVTYPRSDYDKKMYGGALFIPETVIYNSTTYSVTTIGERAFSGYAYVTSVTIIGNSVTTIGERAFENCSGLTSITIPNSVTGIGKWAFYGCSGLTSVSIGNSVTTIGNWAFGGCTGLTSVTIPNSVTTIRNDAFNGVTNIIYNGTATGSPWGAKCVNGYIDGYLVYSDASKTTLCGCFTTAMGEITIPNSVTTIESNAFNGCTGLTSVTIPNSVTTIGEYAFYKCTGLTSIEIPNSVTTIGESTFDGCSGLISIEIPNSVITIGDGAFYQCSGLASITIPNSVTTIENYAFNGCSNLTSVTIGKSVTTIGKYAFYDCEYLKTVYNDSERDIVKGSTSYGYVAYYADKVYAGIPVGDFIIQRDTIVTAFVGNKTEITVPNGITQIGDKAFSGCSGLTSVIIPHSVTTIGKRAFYGCKNLTSVNFGANIESIGDYSFAGCIRIDNMTCFASRTPDITEHTFDNVSRYAYLYVLQEHERKFKIDPYWGDFDIKTIGAEDSSVVDDQVSVDPHDNNADVTWPANDDAECYSLTITKDGAIFCVLTFNGNGQLVGLAFAPSREGARPAPEATLSSKGYTFRVTGLDRASKYGLSLDVKNQDEQVIKTYTRAFATTGYVPQNYTITVNANDNAMGTVTGSGTFEEFTSVTLTAIPNEHYHFVQWSDGNTNNPRTITVEDDATFTALFVIDQFTISVVAENGSVSGAGTYDYGTEVTLTATPNEGYEFVDWSNGVTDNPYTFIVEQDVELTANFKKVDTGWQDVRSGVKATKYFHNGNLIIERNGVKYTPAGQKVR